MPSQGVAGGPNQLIFPLAVDRGARRRRPRSPPLLVASVVLVLLILATVTVLSQFTADPTGGDSGKSAGSATGLDDDRESAARPPASRATVSVFDLAPGTCLAEFVGRELVSAVEVLPCDVPHAAEVVANIRVSGSDWPGEVAVERTAEQCVPVIQEAVAQPADNVMWSYYAPSQDSWTIRDDRGISCLVVSLDQPLTRSLLSHEPAGADQ